MADQLLNAVHANDLDAAGGALTRYEDMYGSMSWNHLRVSVETKMAIWGAGARWMYNRSTPLMVAVESGSLPMVALLLARGVDPNESARVYDSSIRPSDVAEFPAMLDLLMNAGADWPSSISALQMRSARDPAIAQAIRDGHALHVVPRFITKFARLVQWYNAAWPPEVEAIHAAADPGDSERESDLKAAIRFVSYRRYKARLVAEAPLQQRRRRALVSALSRPTPDGHMPFELRLHMHDLMRDMNKPRFM